MRRRSSLVLTSRTKLASQIVEVFRRNVGRRPGVEIGLPRRPELERSGHERGLESHRLRRAKVTEVSGDHHHVRDLEIEQVGRGLIDFAIRFVVAHELGTEDAVPRQTRVLREIGHQRDVSVRQRRNDEALLQAREPGDRVRPRPQPVPCTVERVGFGLG